MRLKRRLQLSSIGVMLFIFALICVPPTKAYTNTLYTDEITLAYDMQNCQLRYWYKNSENRHTLVFNSIQELEGNSIRRTLYLQEDKVDVFEVTQGYQQLKYHIDHYDAEARRANVYINLKITFNEIYIHMWIGTWDLHKEGNTLRLAYSINFSETKYLTIQHNEYCEMTLIVTSQPTSTPSNYFDDFWMWLERFQLLLGIAVLCISILLGVYAVKRKDKCGG